MIIVVHYMRELNRKYLCTGFYTFTSKVNTCIKLRLSKCNLCKSVPTLIIVLTFLYVIIVCELYDLKDFVKLLISSLLIKDS